jgi:hypothetical protein
MIMSFIMRVRRMYESMAEDPTKLFASLVLSPVKISKVTASGAR